MDNKPITRVESSLLAKKKKTGRGYYAELVTNLNYGDQNKRMYPGSHRKTCSIWKVKTEQYAPIRVELVPPRKRVVLAPAQRWMAFDEDRDIVNKSLFKHLSFQILCMV